MKNIKIKCDKCDHEFELKKLKTKKLEDNIQRTYFVCPKCGQEYTSYYTDWQVRLNKQEINRLADKIKKLKGESYIKTHEEMSKLIEFNKIRMKELRQKYEA
ncbi:MAG: hypothetical protein E7211_08695 [Clostridium lundense]|nr:hypothetical protein [Clostridium lundense]